MGFAYAPARSRRNLGAQPVWLPIGFRGRSLPGSGGNCDLTNNALNDYTVWQAPSWGAVTAIRLVYAGYDMSNLGPVDRGVAVTGYASLWMPTAGSFTWSLASGANVASGSTVLPMAVSASSPANQVTAGMAVSGTGISAGTYVVNAAPVYNTSMQLTAYNVALNQAVTQALTNANSLTFSGLITPATWGQARQVTFTPKRDFYVSDPIPCYVAANGYFGIRGNWSFSSAQIALADYPSYSSGTTRLAIGGFTEASNRGSGLADLTLASLALTNTGGGYWPPVMILGLVNDPSPHGAVVIVGDSIAAGTGDTPDSNGRMGYIQRSLSNNVPWVSVARGSTAAIQHFCDVRPIQRLVQLTSATDVILQYCRNDLNNGVTAANTLSYLQAMATPLAGMGCRVWFATCPPTVTGTMTSAAGQTIANSGFEAQRQSYNSAMRSGFASYGGAGLIDMAAVLEDGSNPGKYRTDGGNAYVQADGIHPSALGHQTLINAGVVPVSSFAPA